MGANLDLVGELFLGSVLDSAPLGLEGLIIGMLAQAGQQCCLVDPGVRAECLRDELCQRRVAPSQPPPRRHPVSFVLELLRHHLVEVLCTAAPRSCSSRLHICEIYGDLCPEQTQAWHWLGNGQHRAVEAAGLDAHTQLHQ